jgi:leucyl aminopeptidase
MRTILKRQSVAQANVSILFLGVTEEDAGSLTDLDLSDKLQGLVSEVLRLGDFKGEKGEHALLYTRGAVPFKRLMLVGLGKRGELTLERIRSIMGETSRRVRDLDAESIGISLDHLTQSLDPGDAAKAIVEGFTLGSFRYPFYKTRDLEKFKEIGELQVIAPRATDEQERKVDQGRVISEAVNLCRRLSWGPGNKITPTRLAEEALRLRDIRVKVTVMDRDEAEKVGLKSFLTVARGTDEPPKFIVMEHGEGEEGVDTVALIGKAITFDTGGISLKEREGMPLMKTDMTGGAIVISTMEAVARLGLGLHVVGVVPATDNMPSGRAYHPGDVVDSYAGISIEVTSTDAEGRMILNDALAYAARNYGPAAMFDFATLTGAMEVALGEHAIGYFANDEGIAKRVERASETSGERVWRMPLWDVYDEQLKSDVADWKHTGGRPGGAITAARFLSKFVGETPWVHFDIAGLMEKKGDEGYNPKGSRGPGVRLILDVLRNWGS